MPKHLKFHMGLALAWGVVALVLGIKLALLGCEKDALGRARGADLKTRLDVAFQARHLDSRLEQEASAPALDDAIRRLGLKLGPPTLATNR